MEDNSGREVRPGGAVEPANRAAVSKRHAQTPPEAPAQRYELHDPRSDLTYRAKTFDEMVAKAEQLGALRFVSVQPTGERTTVLRTPAGWQRVDLQPAQAPSKEKQRPANVVPSAELNPATEAVVSRIDADAERQARVARLEAALNERYVIRRASVRLGDLTIGQNEYRHRGDPAKVAFTESTFRLSTDTNSPSVARSMVDVAEARKWQGLRLSGNEDFKRMVWLEASLRGVKTIGYEPAPGDQALLRKEREARQVNRIEPTGASPDAKQSTRGSGSRKTVLAALEAVLIAKQVPEKQRVAVMAAAAEKLARRLRKGESHRVKIYDRSAPSQRPVPAPTRDPQRAREHAGPTK